jgi:hypothetical protein
MIILLASLLVLPWAAACLALGLLLLGGWARLERRN